MVEVAASEELEMFAWWIGSLDKLIHSPPRLAILTVLRRSGEDYAVIQRLTGLSKGNLSKHLAKLEEAELLTIRKRFEGKTPVTSVVLTSRGKAALESYWEGMKNIAERTGDEH